VNSEKRKKFTPMTNFADIPGVRIAYDVSGMGGPLIFLHGGLLDRRQWDGQIDFFARSHRAIRYDMRGAGESETAPSNEPFSHHEDLLRFIQVLEIQRVSLVGLSNFAVALDFATAYPQLVEKLVLVSPGLRGYEYRDPWVAAGFTATTGALARQDLNGAVETMLTMWVDGPQRKPEEVNPLVRARCREMVSLAFRLSRLAPNCTGLEPPAAGRLSEVRAPTLIVLGDKDAPDIHRIGGLLHEGIGGSRLTWIRDAGHTLPMEKANEFNIIVQDFLNDFAPRM
jgi:pimeloyl-ACP methyl ester carboxylesterase